MTSRQGSSPWLLLPALLALAWFAATLEHGFRSDDFLTVYYLDREAETVRWGRVFEEWVRPWFGVRDLYRPLVSLSFGANWALSTSPFGFHLANVLLLAGTATAVATLAARLARQRPVLVGLVAGAVVVLHPAAVEPAAWVAARTTGLQVFWSAVAMATFVRWRQGAGGPWWTVAAAALACASKEGAVLLPVSFVVLSLLCGERPRARVHGPFVALVVTYLLFRKALLGWFTTAEAGHTFAERFGNGFELLGQLLVPPLGGGHALGGVWFLLLFVLLWQVLAAGTQRALWCLPWAGLLLLPGTTHVALREGELAGRFVFDAVPALALFLALAVDVVPSGWLARTRLAVGLLGIGLGLAVASRMELARYGEQDRLVAVVQHELLRAAKDAGPGKPFGVVSLPGQPVLQPGLWGFLAQRPFAPVDLPVVGLAGMLEKDPASPLLFANSTPVHALVANGAGCAFWSGRDEALVAVGKPKDAVVEFVQDPADPRRFVPPGPLPATAVAAIEIEVVLQNPEAALELKVLGNLEGPYARKPMSLRMADGRPAVADPLHRTFWCDTTHVFPWLVAATLGGGPAGVELTLDNGAPPPGTVVRAHASLPRRDPPPTPDVVDREQVVAVLEPPDPHGHYVLYLLLPTGVFAVESPRGRRGLDGATMDQIRFAADVLGTFRLHWFWQEHEDRAAPLRTTFGTCEVR